MILTRDQILGARDFTTEAVEVPEWGGVVHVRSLTGAARDMIEARFVREETQGLKSLIVALTCCDPDGALLFTEADIPALGEKSAAALERVFDAGWRISGLGTGTIEDAEGN